MRLQTLFIDEAHRLESDKNRNDIGPSPLAALFATGAKRGVRLVLSDQLLSRTDPGVLGNLGCRIITRLANPKCIWFAQQSMGLSAAHAARVAQLKKREAIVLYADHPTPFMIRVDEFSFPPKPDEMYLEKIAQDFLGQVAWSEDSGLEGGPVEPEAVTGDALKVFIRIAEVTEPIKNRCKAIDIDRSSELRARRMLEAKGYIAEEEITLGNKKKIYKVTPKGVVRAKKMGIKIKRFKSGAIHEYLLSLIEKKIGSLNTRFKSQRHSEIAREYGIEPDSVLIQPPGLRTIIEICCGNLGYEAKNLVRERTIAGVDRIIAITPNQKVKKDLECALERCQPKESYDAELAPLVILDAGKCLSEKFDWFSVLQRP